MDAKSLYDAVTIKFMIKHPIMFFLIVELHKL